MITFQRSHKNPEMETKSSGHHCYRHKEEAAAHSSSGGQSMERRAEVDQHRILLEH